MYIRTSLALRALRGARWAPAVACGAVAAPLALAAGGGLSAAVPAAAAVTLATALTGGVRGRAGLTGIARAWARAHPWRFAAAPAAALAGVLAVLDVATGWPTVGAALAGLSVLAAPRLGTLCTPRPPVRPAAAPLTGRRLVRALPAAETRPPRVMAAP